MPRLPKNMVRRGGAYYYRQKMNGRGCWRSLGDEYDVALAKLRSLKREGLPSPMTVEDAAKKWLAVYVPTARRVADQQLAAQRVRDYLVPGIGHMLLARLTSEQLRSYRVSLERTALSLQTVRHLLSDCRCLLRWSEEAGYLERAPIPRRWLPRIQERPPDRLTDEEVAQVVIVPEPHGFVCRLGLASGLRWGELVRAQAADVQAGVLTVGRTKSGKLRRVPLPPEVLAELRTRVGRLAPFAERAASSFNRMVRRRSGVERFHVHQLRHTFACRWLEDGGSLAALQELLGHSTIVTTQRYARLGEAHVRAEVERITGTRGSKRGSSTLG